MYLFLILILLIGSNLAFSDQKVEKIDNQSINVITTQTRTETLQSLEEKTARLKERIATLDEQKSTLQAELDELIELATQAKDAGAESFSVLSPEPIVVSTPLGAGAVTGWSDIGNP